jgi:hypothetical protein
LQYACTNRAGLSRSPTSAERSSARRRFFAAVPHDLLIRNDGSYLLVAVLAIAAGLIGVGFKTVLYAMEDRVGALWRGRPEWARPVVGGLALGLLLLALPQMYGVGYPVMDSVIAGHVVFGLVLVLRVGKVAATSPHPVDRRIGRRVRPLSVHRDDDGHGLRHRRDRATGALLRRGIDIERPRRNETLARATGR